MNKSRPRHIRDLAADYFHDLEVRLVDLHVVFGDICKAMGQSVSECRRAIMGSSLVPYLRRRPGQENASQVYWVRTCRPRPTLGAGPGRAGNGGKRWVKHLPGGLTRKRLVQIAKDVGNSRVFGRYDDRFRLLNEARRIIVRARLSFEHTLQGISISRGWETEAPGYAAPLVSSGLPATSKRALGRAWSLCLRLASAELELWSVIDRHNARPVYRGLKLRFERDGAHPYGRSYWTLYGDRLLGHARRLAKVGERVEDPANLTEQVMRKLQIPARERLEIRPYEAARRRLEECRRGYIALLTHLKKLTGVAIARVAGLGEEAQRRSKAG
jgi:hypothetical protein